MGEKKEKLLKQFFLRRAPGYTPLKQGVNESRR
jgi:hypothetical protein